jgi:hypothetical protein
MSTRHGRAAHARGARAQQTCVDPKDAAMLPLMTPATAHSPGYNQAFGLYRAALVQVRAAERFSRCRLPERRIQKHDAVATAMILIQASLESWIRATYAKQIAQKDDTGES